MNSPSKMANWRAKSSAKRALIVTSANQARSIYRYPRQIIGRQTGVAALNADGYGGEVLDRAQLQAMINTPLGEEIVGASYKAGNAMIHSGRLVRAGRRSRHQARCDPVYRHCRTNRL
jgi:hypothetical protein